jgi:hypothetical protein
MPSATPATSRSPPLGLDLLLDRIQVDGEAVGLEQLGEPGPRGAAAHGHGARSVESAARRRKQKRGGRAAAYGSALPTRMGSARMRSRPVAVRRRAPIGKRDSCRVWARTGATVGPSETKSPQLGVSAAPVPSSHGVQLRHARDPDPASVLDVIRGTTRSWEQDPRPYATADEEQRRSILVSALNGAFLGRATAESFNGRGTWTSLFVAGQTTCSLRSEVLQRPEQHSRRRGPTAALLWLARPRSVLADLHPKRCEDGALAAVPTAVERSRVIERLEPLDADGSRGDVSGLRSWRSGPSACRAGTTSGLDQRPPLCAAPASAGAAQEFGDQPVRVAGRLHVW